MFDSTTAGACLCVVDKRTTVVSCVITSQSCSSQFTATDAVDVAYQAQYADSCAWFDQMVQSGSNGTCY